MRSWTWISNHLERRSWYRLLVACRDFDVITASHRRGDVDVTHTIGSINHGARGRTWSFSNNFKFELSLSRRHSVAVCIVSNDAIASGRTNFQVKSSISNQLTARDDSLAWITDSFDYELFAENVH